MLISGNELKSREKKSEALGKGVPLFIDLFFHSLILSFLYLFVNSLLVLQNFTTARKSGNIF